MGSPRSNPLELLSRLELEGASKLRELESRQRELVNLAREAAGEAAALRDRVWELEQRGAGGSGPLSGLMELYAASSRLSHVLDRSELVVSIRDVAATLIGSEEVAIFEYHSENETLELIGSEGIDESALGSLCLQSHPLGRLVGEKRVFVFDEMSELCAGYGGVSACIPLCFRERLVGAVLIFRLLAQKVRLGSTDRELCELLSQQAGAALFRARALDHLPECAP